MTLRIARSCVSGAFVLTLALLAVATVAHAEPDESGRPVFRNFRPTDYRGHPQVYSLDTAANGLVYLSSEQGINEYDGVRWRHLPVPVSMIFALQATPDGRIWIGGQDEFGYFAPDGIGGELAYHSLSAQLPPGLKAIGRVRSLVVIGESVFISLARHIVRWKRGQTQVWDFASRFPRLHNIGGQLYAHVAGEGLLRLDGDRFVSVSAAAAFTPNSESALFPLANGKLLAVVAQSGFFELDPATGALTPWATPAAALLRDARIVASARLRDGSFVLGTQTIGLVIVSTDGTRVRRLDRTTGLLDNVVLSLATDPAGGLWVGYNTGAARVEIDSPVSVFDGNNGPASGTIDCWGRHAGRLYAGAFDGLWQLEPGDSATGAGAHFTKDPRPITNVFAIEPYESDTLVAGGPGLCRLLPDRIETLVESRPNNPLCLVLSRLIPGRVYIGGSLGLTVAQKTPTGWTKLAEFHNLGDVHTAIEEPDGTLWLATYSRGFWQLPAAHLVADWKSVQPRQFFKDCGLPSAINWTAVSAAPGGASLFTDQGSFRFLPRDARCRPDDRFQLPGESRLAIFPLVHAANGDGWATVYTTSTLESDYPLGRFISPSLGSTWQPAPSAALAEIGFAGAAVMALDHTTAGAEIIWARGYHNTVRIALNHAPRAPAPWRAAVRTLTANGHAQPLAAARPPLRLPFSREPITFTIAAPNWGAGGYVRFSTRLVGYSEKWSASMARAEVNFTNLQGGPFTLEVRALDAEGRVSAPARFTFSVAPPWPRSPLAYALYALAGVAAIYGYTQWRLARGGRERTRLEKLVATRTGELAAARDAAEAANRAKSSFLASMSHELRTPLNGVIGYAQVLHADRRLTPDQQERVRIVQSSGEHLLRMINDVLDLAKIEAGKLTVRPAPCALGDLLRDIASAHAAAADAKKISFQLDLAPGLPEWVECDAQKLRQILDNLIGNAVKFTTAGRVALHVRPAETFVAFSVTDTGPGISAADQARLFHAFEQANDARPDAPGTGLGLAICRALVERLGGKLTLTSAPGAGCTFRFALALPALAPAAPAHSSSQRIAGYEGDRRRVLVVDDHDINRQLLVDLLTPLGFVCAEFAVPSTALARLTDGAEPWPDLAIVDVRMAGLDGLALTRALRALPRGQQLKILLTSASVLSFNLDEGRRAGADDFIAKPFRTAELLEKLGRLLALRWRDADSAPPFAPPVSTDPLPAAVRAALREHLAQGDLDALRTELAALRTAQPGAALDALDEAAARFDLPRLRGLLG